MNTMTTTLNVPEQGQLVQVRSRQWVVNEVKPSSLPAVAMKPSFAGPQNLLMLSSVEDDGLGEELQVVWEIEPGAGVIEKVALLKLAEIGQDGCGTARSLSLAKTLAQPFIT